MANRVDQPKGPPILWPDLNPAAVDLWLTATVGPDYPVFEPETLWEEIRRVVGSVPGELSRNRICAVQVARSPHDRVFKDWEVFFPVVNALVGTIPNFALMEPPLCGNLLAGADALLNLRKEELSDEVIRFCTAVAQYHGVVYLPEPLMKANEYLRVSNPVLHDGVRDRLRTVREPDRLLVDHHTYKVQQAIIVLEAFRRQRVEHLDVMRREVGHVLRGEGALT